VFLTRALSIQIFLGLLGLLVFRRQDYAQRFLAADAKPSVGAFALICQGVALSVMLQFWVNKGLVEAGLFDKFSNAYRIATMPSLILQGATIILFLRLVRMHFGKARLALDVTQPAE
jgi:hypothetical protein